MGENQYLARNIHTKHFTQIVLLHPHCKRPVGITFSDKEAKGVSLLSKFVPWVSGIVRI